MTLYNRGDLNVLAKRIKDSPRPLNTLIEFLKDSPVIPTYALNPLRPNDLSLHPAYLTEEEAAELSAPEEEEMTDTPEDSALTPEDRAAWNSVWPPLPAINTTREAPEFTPVQPNPLLTRILGNLGGPETEYVVSEEHFSRLVLELKSRPDIHVTAHKRYQSWAITLSALPTPDPVQRSRH